MPSASALAFCGYARKAMHDAVQDSEGELGLSADVLSLLERCLSDWEVQAAKAPTLSLSFDISSDQAEYLSLAFFRVATYLTARADRQGFDESPVEGDEFYRALVEAVLDALEHGDYDSTSEFGDYLRSFWPRIERLGQEQ